MRINTKLVQYLLILSFSLAFFSFSGTPVFSQDSGCEGTLFFHPPAPDCTAITPTTVTLAPATAQSFTAVYSDGEGVLGFDWSANDNGGGSFTSTVTNPATYTTPSRESGVRDGDTISINVIVSEGGTTDNGPLGRTSSCPAATITMSVANTAPACSSLSVTPSTGDFPLTVVFTASGSDTDGTITLYEFDFGDGHAVFSTTENTATHTYASASTFTPSFRVRDDSLVWSGSAVECQTTVVVTTPLVSPETHKVCENCACVYISGSGTDECSSVSDCACIPECISISASPTYGRNPLLVSFSAVAVSQGSSISSYIWNFGEGGATFTTTTDTTTHSYPSVGTFTAAVNMRSASGDLTLDTQVCEVVVTVTGASAPVEPAVDSPPVVPVASPVASPSAIDTGTESSSFYIALAVVLFSVAMVLYIQFQPGYNYVQRVRKIKKQTRQKWEKFEKKFEDF